MGGLRPRTLRAALLACVLAVLTLLAGCAAPIAAKVTSFNVWPADAAGASFSYLANDSKASELEQATYEGYVRAELEHLGLKQAPPGQTGRFLVDVIATGGTRQKVFLEPVYEERQVYIRPTRDAAGNVYPGYWAADPFGSRYVGDREVTRTVQVGRLKLRLLDINAATVPGRPRAVFEAMSVYEGDNEDLPDLVPYLVRAIFVDFPGKSGRVHIVKFEGHKLKVLER